jgi:site-specific recombinase XerD
MGSTVKTQVARKHLSIADHIERFLELRAARSVHTARTYRMGLNHFCSYLSERGVDLTCPPALLTRSIALDFIPWLAQQRFAPDSSSPERELSMRSRKLYVRAVSGLYRQLALEGIIPLAYGDYAALNAEMNKATSFRPPPIEKRLPSTEVMEAILEAVTQPPRDLARPDLSDSQRRRLELIWQRDQAIVQCLYSTGMRVGELVKLRRADLAHDDQGAWVHGKGGRVRYVRFSQQAWQALATYLAARQDLTAGGSPGERPVFCRHDDAAGKGRRLPLSTRSVERMITDLAKESGTLERFHLTPHSFRHYFATRFLGHTGDLALTQDALGHADPGTTRIYAKTTKAQHIRAHRELFDTRDSSEGVPGSGD